MYNISIESIKNIGDWIMNAFTNKPHLHGNRVSLRPFLKNDSKRMFEIISIPDVIYYTGSADTWDKINNPDTSIETYHTIEKWYSTLSEKDNRLDLAITIDSLVIGEVVINEYDSTNKTANFRVLMDTNYASKGLGYEAIKLFIDYCVVNLPVDTYRLEVFNFNIRAQQTYKKVGFKPVSVIENDWILDGISYDSIVMELNSNEYKLNNSL